MVAPAQCGWLELKGHLHACSGGNHRAQVDGSYESPSAHISCIYVYTINININTYIHELGHS